MKPAQIAWRKKRFQPENGTRGTEPGCSLRGHLPRVIVDAAHKL